MSVNRGLAMKAAIVAVLNRQVPLPSTTEEWQDRQFAVADALADELAGWLVWKNPGVELSVEFIEDTIASFAAEVLIPFGLASVQQLSKRAAEKRH